jgi:tetratricopeptide (TPR) repeat protein
MNSQTSSNKIDATLADGTAKIATAIKQTSSPFMHRIILVVLGAVLTAVVGHYYSNPSSSNTQSVHMVVHNSILPPTQPPPLPIGTRGTIKSAADDVSVGKRYADRGDYASALDAFRRATAADSSNSFAWANLGAAAAMLGRSTESVNAYDHALAIDPENWLAHYNLGCQLLRLGKREEAFVYISRGVALARRQARASAERKATLDRLRSDDATRELRNDPRFDALFTAE